MLNIKNILIFLFIYIPTIIASGIFGLGDSGETNSDSSQNQNLLVKGDSILTGESNSFVPSLDIGGISGIGSSHVH